MVLALVGLAVVSIAELSLWMPLFWRRRVIFARLLILLLALATGSLLVSDLAVWTVLVAVFSLYRGFNLARVSADRTQPDYLFHASYRTAISLMAMQLAVALIVFLSLQLGLNAGTWWTGIAAAQLAVAAILLATTLRHIRTTHMPRGLMPLREKDLPSLTVAIPARNETSDLEACLTSLTASTYPKLEIIVLDDCSQNKRTPEIIRSFAHAGVRFIAGTVPSEGWLAKNYAYAQLAEEANGSLLLFCGVDTRFSPESLTMIVSAMLQKHKSMMSILPRNVRKEPHRLLSWFLQPSRYAWELALPRRLIRRPPVLSTCWLITRQSLEAAGGFGAVRRKGVPESYFARMTAEHGDGYSFMQAYGRIGVISEKSLEEQKATAVRTRYLQMHRKPEMTALISLAELGVLLWPIALCIVSVLGNHGLLALLSGVASLLNLFVYGRLAGLTYRRFLPFGFIVLPFAVLYDIGLLNYSMRQYEFGEVLWKGRNVCIPIMRAIPELPKIS